MPRRSVWTVLRRAGTTLAWIGAPFAGAGRLDWTRGWICVALYTICMPALGAIVKRVNAPVLDARKKWLRPDTKPFDKVFVAVFLPLVYLQPLIAGLDAVRFRWSSMPFWLVFPGALLFLLSLALIGWSLAVNRFAENSVRIQADRGHCTIASGPYRVVRHPMYVGSIFMYIATALILGSVLALVAAGVIAVLFIWRTTLEDRTLRAELTGYAEYAARTRYRLLPSLW
jgi:protein-S-isoprenylcysteine O-methyltransferase Ste14